MQGSSDSRGEVDLNKVAQQIRGDKVAEAALEVVKAEYSSIRPVTVSDGCSGTRTVMRDMPAESLNGQGASSVFNALVSAKQKATSLDTDGDHVLSKAEREAADQFAGFIGRLVEAVVGQAGKIEPIGTSC